jgi:hypothetical protein
MQLVRVGEYVLVSRAEAKLTVARATAEVEKRIVRGKVKFVLGRLCKQ